VKHNLLICRRCHALPTPPVKTPPISFIFLNIQLEILAQQIVQQYRHCGNTSLDQLLTVTNIFDNHIKMFTKYQYKNTEKDMLKILIIKEWINYNTLMLNSFKKCQ
jgi:hypothetical protein